MTNGHAGIQYSSPRSRSTATGAPCLGGAARCLVFDTGQPLPLPRRIAPGFLAFVHPPDRGAGGAPSGASLCRRACRARHRADEARRVPFDRDARPSTLHLGDFRLRVRASASGISSGARATSSSWPGLSARRAASAPPEMHAVTSRSRGTPNLAPPTGLSPETPLDEQGCSGHTMFHCSSQVQYVVIR
jgi:hypothetical protein